MLAKSPTARRKTASVVQATATRWSRFSAAKEATTARNPIATTPISRSMSVAEKTELIRSAWLAGVRRCA